MHFLSLPGLNFASVSLVKLHGCIGEYSQSAQIHHNAKFQKIWKSTRHRHSHDITWEHAFRVASHRPRFGKLKRTKPGNTAWKWKCRAKAIWCDMMCFDVTLTFFWSFLPCALLVWSCFIMNSIDSILDMDRISQQIESFRFQTLTVLPV